MMGGWGVGLYGRAMQAEDRVGGEGGGVGSIGSGWDRVARGLEAPRHRGNLGREGVQAEERLHWRSFLVKLGTDNLSGAHNEELFVASHKSVYVVYTAIGDVSIFVVGKDEYDELACSAKSGGLATYHSSPTDFNAFQLVSHIQCVHSILLRIARTKRSMLAVSAKHGLDAGGDQQSDALASNCKISYGLAMHAEIDVEILIGMTSLSTPEASSSGMTLEYTGSTIPIVPTQVFDKVIKSSISCYMVFVKESKEGACVLKESCSETKEKSEMSDLLNEFQDVFTDDIPNELPPTRGQDDHTIELLPGSSPSNKPPYKVSQAQQEIMKQVNELVEKGMYLTMSQPRTNYLMVMCLRIIAVAEVLYAITSSVKDVCKKTPTERIFLEKYGKVCLCLDEIVFQGTLEHTDKDRIRRLTRLKPLAD
ncbi:hypothetical protein L7F22_026758 [Adiantum nelumboides]|nr:hypothetical protein [Adiantum nelumboides]